MREPYRPRNGPNTPAIEKRIPVNRRAFPQSYFRASRAAALRGAFQQSALDHVSVRRQIAAKGKLRLRAELHKPFTGIFDALYGRLVKTDLVRGSQIEAVAADIAREFDSERNFLKIVRECQILPSQDRGRGAELVLGSDNCANVVEHPLNATATTIAFVDGLGCASAATINSVRPDATIASASMFR